MPKFILLKVKPMFKPHKPSRASDHFYDRTLYRFRDVTPCTFGIAKCSVPPSNATHIH